MGARETYFGAVTPGSVAFPAALIENESSLSRFRFAEQNGHVIVFDVPLMDEHVDPERDKPFDKFNGKTFDAVVASTQEYERKGAYCQIIIGHTDGDNDDEFTHPVVGHIRNFKSTGRAGKRQMVGDMWFRKDFFESDVRTNKFPRRSAEISRVDLRLDPVAVLGATSPARPLPDLLFKKLARPDNNEVYMTTHGNKVTVEIGDEPMDPVLEAIEKLSKRLDPIEAAIDKFQAADDDKKDDDEEDKDKKKKKKKFDEHGNEIKDEDDDKDKESGDHGPRDKNKSSAQQDRERFAVMSNKLDGLTKQVTGLESENVRLKVEHINSEIDSKVIYMKRIGVQLGDDEAVVQFKKDLCGLDSEARERRYQEIEEHYQRVPVDTHIDRGGIEIDVPNSGDPVDAGQDAAVAAMKAAEKYGMTMEKAHQILQTEGASGFEKFNKKVG